MIIRVSVTQHFLINMWNIIIIIKLSGVNASLSIESFFILLPLFLNQLLLYLFLRNRYSLFQIFVVLNIVLFILTACLRRWSIHVI